jgi:hypothetical protein
LKGKYNARGRRGMLIYVVSGSKRDRCEGEDGCIMLRRIFEKKRVVVWTGLVYLR